MDKKFFHDYYLQDLIGFTLKEFIKSNRYSIGYSVSQKIKQDYWVIKPVLTYQLNNVSYDQDNNLVSINQINYIYGIN